MAFPRQTHFVRRISLWIGLCAFLWLEPGLTLAIARTYGPVGGPLLPTKPIRPRPSFTAADPAAPASGSIDVVPTTRAEGSAAGASGIAATASYPFVSNPAADLTLDPQSELSDDPAGSSPFYKKAWFLIAAAGAIALTAVLIATSGDDGGPSDGGESLPDFPPPPSSRSSVTPQGCAR